MILSLEGDESCGKSTLAYSAPLPIVGFSFDLGSERAIYGSRFDSLFKDLKIEIIGYKPGTAPTPAWDSNDITIYEMPQPIQLDQGRLLGFAEQWSYFVGLFSKAAMDERVRTIVVDTMTLARRIKADAYLQELQEAQPGKPRKQLLQIEYGHANDSIRNLYTLMAGLKKNLVAVHHLTDEYKNSLDKDGQPVSTQTGVRVLEGLSQTHRYVDVAMLLEKGKGKITGKMLKCGYSLELEGMPMEGPTWDSIVDLVGAALGGRIVFDKRAQ